MKISKKLSQFEGLNDFFQRKNYVYRRGGLQPENTQGAAVRRPTDEHEPLRLDCEDTM